MPFRTFDVNCQFNSTTSGTTAFTIGTAFGGGSNVTPSGAAGINGNTYQYYAQDATGAFWELGSGVLSATQLTRVTVKGSSNTNNAGLVNFATNPVVMVFPNPPTTLDPGVTSSFIPSGTTMVFHNSAAPVGWTRVTSFDDAAIRIVATATPSSGGSNAYSTVMAQTVTGSHTSTLADMVDHSHSDNEPSAPSLNIPGGCPVALSVPGSTGNSTGGMGGGSGSHNHTILMNMRYVDFLIASKN